jgi:uncharacterized protein with NRDE domain
MKDDGPSTHSDVPDLSDCFLAILREPPRVNYSSVAEAMQIMKQAMEHAKKQKPRTVLTDDESRLLDTIVRLRPIRASDLEKVRSQLTTVTADQIITFAEDAAEIAARTNRPELLLPGLLGLVVDLDQNDWRDVLTTMSVINDCVLRLQINFEKEISSLLSLATDRRRQTIEGFFKRTPEERRLCYFGLAATGSGEELRYESTYPPG